MSVRNYLDFKPQIDGSSYIDEAACVIGRVKIGKNSSVWPGAVIRGDINEITLGNNSNIQDGVVLHVTHELGVHIGDYVTVGHLAMIHGAKIGDNSLIGIGAIVLDGAVVGKNTVVAAGSLVPPNAVIPDGVMVMGSPAKVKRELSEAEIKSISENCMSYVNIIKDYKK
ncbi:MAG TPA: gamma carbonic anhydrase family protein [Candidatus Wallbacteria bacterium]|nr:gamma carbonic anhydrase family protein [Candidatus Wallbacteria bacterium]